MTSMWIYYGSGVDAICDDAYGMGQMRRNGDITVWRRPIISSCPRDPTNITMRREIPDSPYPERFQNDRHRSEPRSTICPLFSLIHASNTTNLRLTQGSATSLPQWWPKVPVCMFPCGCYWFVPAHQLYFSKLPMFLCHPVLRSMSWINSIAQPYAPILEKCARISEMSMEIFDALAVRRIFVVIVSIMMMSIGASFDHPSLLFLTHSLLYLDRSM